MRATFTFETASFGWLPTPWGCNTIQTVTWALILTRGVITSHAQENQSSLAGEAAFEARAAQVESRPYTIKQGDFRLLLAPQLGLDYNDNIRISSENQEDDFILRPALQLTASYPIGKRNLLSLVATVGYDFYLQHSDYSAFRLDTGSVLSFDIYLGDYLFNLHDRFSYTQDPGSQAALANAGRYGGFRNTGGLTVTRDFPNALFSVGYDHRTFISSTAQYEYQNNNAELVNARAGFRVHPTVTAGVEATGSYTYYDQPFLNDNTGISGGLFADWRPSRYLGLSSTAGYTMYWFDQTSLYLKAVDQDAWYVSLTLTHSPTEVINYSISGGHELRLGLQADTVEAWYARANINWNLVKYLRLNTAFSYENATQGGNNSSRYSEDYDWLSGSIGLAHDITRRLHASLNYRYTWRTSTSSGRDYTQNLVGLLFTYLLQ